MAVHDINNIKIFKVVTGELLIGEFLEGEPSYTLLLKIEGKGENLNVRTISIDRRITEDPNPNITTNQIVWKVKPPKEIIDNDVGHDPR